LIAKEALDSPQVRRLMTVPGLNVICAAIFVAAVGDIRRFKEDTTHCPPRWLPVDGTGRPARACVGGTAA
jgi:transposase IS116/IS110/IS902 family protein